MSHVKPVSSEEKRDIEVATFDGNDTISSNDQRERHIDRAEDDGNGIRRSSRVKQIPKHLEKFVFH